MEREVVFEFIKNKLYEQGAIRGEINDETPLKLRALMRIKMFICCEKKFGVEISLEEEEKLKTIGDVVDFFYKEQKLRK